MVAFEHEPKNEIQHLIRVFIDATPDDALVGDVLEAMTRILWSTVKTGGKSNLVDLLEPFAIAVICGNRLSKMENDE